MSKRENEDGVNDDAPVASGSNDAPSKRKKFERASDISSFFSTMSSTREGIMNKVASAGAVDPFIGKEFVCLMFRDRDNDDEIVCYVTDSPVSDAEKYLIKYICDHHDYVSKIVSAFFMKQLSAHKSFLETADDIDGGIGTGLDMIFLSKFDEAFDYLYKKVAVEDDALVHADFRKNMLEVALGSQRWVCLESSLDITKIVSHPDTVNFFLCL